MPLPSPQKNQNRDDFISQCMSNEVMSKEFSDSKEFPHSMSGLLKISLGVI